MIKQKFIILRTKVDQNLIGELLHYLHEEADTEPTERSTFLGIINGLTINILNEKELERIRLHLWHLEKEGLIEERRFTNQVGLIDYSLEPRAYTYLKTLPTLTNDQNQEEAKLEIEFKTELDKDFIKNLLSYFSKTHERFDDTSFLAIAKAMNVDISNNNELEKLRLHLVHLEKEGFIKERGYVGPEELIYLYYALEPKTLALYSENWRANNTYPPTTKI